MQVDAKTSALILIDLQRGVLAFRQIVPRLARITSSEGVTLG
jgi:nicotinamidase-related amidase